MDRSVHEAGVDICTGIYAERGLRGARHLPDLKQAASRPIDRLDGPCHMEELA